MIWYLIHMEQSIACTLVESFIIDRGYGWWLLHTYRGCWHLLMTWALVWVFYTIQVNLLSWDLLHLPSSMNHLEPHVPLGRFVAYLLELVILELERLCSTSFERSTCWDVYFHDENLRTPCTCFHGILLEMSTLGLGLHTFSYIWMRSHCTLLHEGIHFI